MVKGRFTTILSIASFRILDQVHNFLYAIISGFWLGVMSEESLDLADERYYCQIKKYSNDRYNSFGLFRWEEVVIKSHFSNAKNFLLIAAGGGREALALAKMGFVVDSYECNSKLIESGNILLQKNGIDKKISYLPRNAVPSEIKIYDGIIIGWAAYTHIRGHNQRLAFIQKLHQFLKNSESALMVSFEVRRSPSEQEKVIKFVSNIFRCLSHRDKVELGDRLIPVFAHYFSEDEIKKEFVKAGYIVNEYSEVDYGCIIATEQR